MKLIVASSFPLINEYIKVVLSDLDFEFELLEVNNITQLLEDPKNKLGHLLIIVENPENQIQLQDLLFLKEKFDHVAYFLNNQTDKNIEELVEIGFNNLCHLQDREFAIKQCILSTINQEPYISSKIIAGLSNSLHLISNQCKCELSEKEIKVIKLAWDGHLNKEIAHLLNISIRTVESHKFRIKEKLDVNSFTGVFKKGLKNGILKL